MSREADPVSAADLRFWLHEPDVETFPYAAVLKEYRRVGKHLVSSELLDLLNDVRAILPAMHAPWPYVRTLASFLSAALDKSDKRYDYSTYLALSLLPMPAVDDPVELAPLARSRCDRLTAQLVSDELAFELSAVDGRTTLLPDMQPAADLLLRRYKQGLRVVFPVLERTSLSRGLTATHPADLAHEVSAMVLSDLSSDERRALELSMLPVCTMHDEYMFLRILQAFETMFSLLAVQLHSALTVLLDGEVGSAVHFLCGAEAALRESAPLFSMMATMQVEAFRTFRQLTEGASAIQSRNYKRVESLCSTPDSERIHSSAYCSVPDVQMGVLAGHPTLDGAYRQACASNLLAEAERERLREAMRMFARALLRWRQTHYRLAVRMLGDAPGTGYTEGTEYLNAARSIPVFRNVEVGHEAVRTP
jgi:tryptophan 2,3-dioxygenase